jgi:hypothetical protein
LGGLPQAQYHWRLLTAFPVLLVRRTPSENAGGRACNGLERSRHGHRTGAGEVVWVQGVKQGSPRLLCFPTSPRPLRLRPGDNLRAFAEVRKPNCRRNEKS